MTEIETPRRGYPVLAWLVIVGVVGFILYRNANRPAGEAAAWVVPMQMQGRMLVGFHNLKFPGASGPELLAPTRKQFDREPVDSSTYSKYLRLAILSGEVDGPAAALADLGELETERLQGELTAPTLSVEAAKLLIRLYSAFEKGDKLPPLSAEEQATLRNGLGWYGDLALAPDGGDPAARQRALTPAYRTVVGVFVVMLGGLICLVSGTLLFIAFGYFSAIGRLRGMYDSGRGGVYAETFAAYMLSYVGMGWVMHYLPESWSGLWLSGSAMVLSLAALAWPILRGIPWRVVRADLGLHLGKQPLLEILYGVGTYLCAVPILSVAIIFLAILSRGRPPGSGPTHPIVGVATERGWLVWVQVFIIASVLAPLVEEIMFRGALYRHLREVSGGWGRLMSVMFASLWSGFVFAVIHPQGWLAVPALGGLALVFALVREWRGTLLPSMVAHGVNNGVVTMLLLMMAA